MEFVNAERDRAARICQIEHRRAEDDSVQHRMPPSTVSPVSWNAGTARPSSLRRTSAPSLRRKSSRVRFEQGQVETEDASAVGTLADGRSLLASLCDFPLPPDVPARYSQLVASTETWSDEDEQEEHAFMFSQRNWTLSAASSEMAVLPPDVPSLVLDLGSEPSDDEHVGSPWSRPSSPDVGELIKMSIPRFQTSRRSFGSEHSADELDLHTPLAESAMKHGIISRKSSLLSPPRAASPKARRRPKLARKQSSSAALRAGAPFTSGLGWSGSEDEQEIEERAAVGRTPVAQRHALGVASSSRLSPNSPRSSRSQSCRSRGPPLGLSVTIPPPSTYNRLSIISHTSSTSTALATPDANDPWGDFETIRNPWDLPECPPRPPKHPARRKSLSHSSVTSSSPSPSPSPTPIPKTSRVPAPVKQPFLPAKRGIQRSLSSDEVLSPSRPAPLRLTRQSTLPSLSHDLLRKPPSTGIQKPRSNLFPSLAAERRKAWAAVLE